MRNHQSHPADQSAQTHGRGAEQRGCADENQPIPLQIDAEASCLLILQRQQIDAPAQTEDHSKSENHGQGAPRKRVHAGLGQAAHQPEGDLLKDVLRVCDVFDHGHAGIAQRHHHGAGQHQNERLLVGGAPADNARERHCRNAACKRSQLNGPVRCAQQNGKGCAQTGAGGYAQNIRGDQGIAEHALIGSACNRQ